MSKKIATGIIVIITLVVVGVVWMGKSRQDIVKKESKERLKKDKNSENMNPKLTEDEKEKKNETIDVNNWKSYENVGWKYSIKYPLHLFIKDNPQGDKFPGDEKTPFDGGQTLIISSEEDMGIQDVMPDEVIRIEITTERFDKNKTIKEFINASSKDADNNSDGNTSIEKNVIVNNATEYNVIIHKEVKEWPYFGEWKGQKIIFDTNYKYLVKDDWIYEIRGEVTYLEGKNVTEKDFMVVRKIISTFEFVKDKY